MAQRKTPIRKVKTTRKAKVKVGNGTNTAAARSRKRKIQTRKLRRSKKKGGTN
jgi:hypothetical protein